MKNETQSDQLADFLAKVPAQLEQLQADAELLEKNGDQQGADKVRREVAKLRRQYEAAMQRPAG